MFNLGHYQSQKMTYNGHSTGIQIVLSLLYFKLSEAELSGTCQEKGNFKQHFKEVAN